jgi:hypothetical protein
MFSKNFFWSPLTDLNRRVLTDPDYKSGAINHYAKEAYYRIGMNLSGILLILHTPLESCLVCTLTLLLSQLSILRVLYPIIFWGGVFECSNPSPAARLSSVVEYRITLLQQTIRLLLLLPQLQ